MKFKFSLKNKISLTVVCLIIFFGVTAVISTVFLSRNALYSEKELDMLLAVEAQSHEIREIIRNSKEVAKKLSENSDVVEFLQEPSSVEKNIYFHT